jgi:hypothetical protein
MPGGKYHKSPSFYKTMSFSSRTAEADNIRQWRGSCDHRHQQKRFGHDPTSRSQCIVMLYLSLKDLPTSRRPTQRSCANGAEYDQ